MAIKRGNTHRRFSFVVKFYGKYFYGVNNNRNAPVINYTVRRGFDFQRESYDCIIIYYNVIQSLLKYAERTDESEWPNVPT